jgi:hypothetical protein
MRSWSLCICLIALALLITVAIPLSCAQPAPTLIPLNTPAPPTPTPKSNVDTPAYKDSEVIGIAGNQQDVKALYATAETTRDYKFPEDKDFNWSAQYLGSGRWFNGTTMLTVTSPGRKAGSSMRRKARCRRRDNKESISSERPS